MRIFVSIALITMSLIACRQTENPYPATLMTCDPGHFHAGLVQKFMYADVNPQVYVFAPDGPELKIHLDQIEGYNQRPDQPTSWKTNLYTGSDFFEQLLEKKPGNVLVLAGNNQKKTDYILEAVRQGLHVFSDKPMAIKREDFELLKSAFAAAEDQQVLLMDMMTERFEITSILQKEISRIPEIFGEFKKGSAEDPSVIKESVHHFNKQVSGNTIVRPPWFFDVAQEGDGLVDVTTHLVDLIQWSCYPGIIIDCEQDIEMLAASLWATPVSRNQFAEVTRVEDFPSYLANQLDDNGMLPVHCNGEMIYRLKDVHARVKVEWNYKAPEGGGDTHYSLMRGTLADLEIRQGASENYQPELYILSHEMRDDPDFLKDMKIAFSSLTDQYPGIQLVADSGSIRVDIPDEYRVGHEAHFAQVTGQFLEYLKTKRLPDWEVPNMIARYHTTTAARELAIKTR